MNPIWTIERLGHLRAIHHDRVISEFRTQKTAALLAYLAFYRRPHSREVLIELLWPDSELEPGRNNLRMALSSLRRQLEPPGAGAGSVIVSNRSTVELNNLTVATDVAEFLAALKVAARADDPATQVSHLARAAAVYHGPLLPKRYEDWILLEQARLEGIPLALELVAARAAVMSPTQMLTRLTDDPAITGPQHMNLVARHQSLHAALD